MPMPLLEVRVVRVVNAGRRGMIPLARRGSVDQYS
jgi:hypothetical protein